MTGVPDREAAAWRLNDRLRRLCREAERDLPWVELAAFINKLHAEHETFMEKINRREIGAHRG